MSVMTVEPLNYEELVRRGLRVYDGMGLGFITADNIDHDDRWAVTEMWNHAPRKFEVQGNMLRPVEFTRLVEGQDWCWATVTDDTLGTYLLDEPTRTFLEGATFHLWISDGTDDPQDAGRLDFTDLAEYQEAALEQMLRPSAD